jgi:hypothetical protein
MRTIPVHLAVEDELSEAVLRRVLKHANRGYAVGITFGRSGYGYLRNSIGGWNRAARGVPFVVLTDLDTYPCPAALLDDWIPSHRHTNLLLRVAVREVEPWVLADPGNLSVFLRVKPSTIPRDPDSLPDPKAVLVDAASRSRSREIRSRVAPRRGSTAKQGPDYNACLIQFVDGDWNIDSAVAASPSLGRTVARLRSFAPSWDVTS